jgi:methylated-DNA-[protein]-cysteine S-methyltransferase
MGRLTIDSPLGALTLTSTTGALTALDWNLADRHADTDPVLEEAARQLRQYFAGDRTGFELPLQPHGTLFQKRVWATMLEIPCGKTATYGGLARQLD